MLMFYERIQLFISLIITALLQKSLLRKWEELFAPYTLYISESGLNKDNEYN